MYNVLWYFWTLFLYQFKFENRHWTSRILTIYMHTFSSFFYSRLGSIFFEYRECSDILWSDLELQRGEKDMVLCFVEFANGRCALTALEALQGSLSSFNFLIMIIAVNALHIKLELKNPAHVWLGKRYIQMTKDTAYEQIVWDFGLKQLIL